MLQFEKPMHFQVITLYLSMVYSNLKVIVRENQKHTKLDDEMIYQCIFVLCIDTISFQHTTSFIIASPLLHRLYIQSSLMGCTNDRLSCCHLYKRTIANVSCAFYISLRAFYITEDLAFILRSGPIISVSRLPLTKTRLIDT